MMFVIIVFLFLLSFYLFKYIYNICAFNSISSYEYIEDFNNLAMNKMNKLQCKYPLKEQHVSYILVFLLSRDRLYATYYSIKFWLKLNKKTKLKIVILDHNTTYNPLLKYYAYLRKKYYIHIYHLKQANWGASINKEVPQTIRGYLRYYSYIKYYILSDIDIILFNIPPDILDFYATLLCNCNVTVIGPSLMINDISTKFPDYKKVYNFETKYFKTPHYDMLYKNKYFSVIMADIDTIFGMRKSFTRFKRHSELSYRSLSPYIAHHIDWYIASDNLPKSFVYYVTHTKSINHSGSAFNISNSLKQP